MRFLLLFLSLSLGVRAFAQSLLYDERLRLRADTNFSIAGYDHPPEFKGGEAALLHVFMDRFRYPEIYMGREDSLILHAYINASGYCDSVGITQVNKVKKRDIHRMNILRSEAQKRFTNWVPVRIGEKDTASVYHIPLCPRFVAPKVKFVNNGWLVYQVYFSSGPVNPEQNTYRFMEGWKIQIEKNREDVQSTNTLKNKDHKYALYVRDGKKTVSWHEYKQQEQEWAYDDEYITELWFEIPIHKTRFRINPQNAGKYRLYYGTACYCPVIGASILKNTRVYGRKLNNTEWEVKMINPRTGTKETVIYTKQVAYYNTIPF